MKDGQLGLPRGAASCFPTSLRDVKDGGLVSREGLRLGQGAWGLSGIMAAGGQSMTFLACCWKAIKRLWSRGLCIAHPKLDSMRKRLRNVQLMQPRVFQLSAVPSQW